MLKIELRINPPTVQLQAGDALQIRLCWSQVNLRQLQLSFECRCLRLYLALQGQLAARADLHAQCDLQGLVECRVEAGHQQARIAQLHEGSRRSPLILYADAQTLYEQLTERAAPSDLGLI